MVLPIYARPRSLPKHKYTSFDNIAVSLCHSTVTGLGQWSDKCTWLDSAFWKSSFKRRHDCNQAKSIPYRKYDLQLWSVSDGYNQYISRVLYIWSYRYAAIKQLESNVSKKKHNYAKYFFISGTWAFYIRIYFNILDIRYMTNKKHKLSVYVNLQYKQFHIENNVNTSLTDWNNNTWHLNDILHVCELKMIPLQLIYIIFRKMKEMTVHHICCISCLGLAVVTKKYMGLSMLVLNMEINSIFLHTRWVVAVLGISGIIRLTYKNL